LKLMSQFQAQIPDPLADDTPCLLPPGGVAAPTIRVDLLLTTVQKDGVELRYKPGTSTKW